MTTVSLWLLDHNVSSVIADFLRTNGISCVTAREKGWEHLSNGKLVEAAAIAGISALLTKDKLFEESANKSLKQHTQMAIVLIRMRQAPESQLIGIFAELWKEKPIQPIIGKLVVWP